MLDAVPLTFSLNAPALPLQILAVLQAGNGKIALWDANKRATTMIDTTMKDPSFIKWSKLGPQLAIGTAKGNLVLYNKDSRKITPVQGKHSKKITCGDWSSSSNVLALGGQDSIMTVRCGRVVVSVSLWVEWGWC